MTETEASQLSDHLQHDHVAELLIAPGIRDLTFGSLLSTMLRQMFSRVETLDADAPHRFYLECKQCGGTDIARQRGVRSQIAGVRHEEGCLLAKHMPRLMAMANKDVT